ncbi:MAG: TIGR03619 family F420-dependent LLM class oxidoreductase [Gammaproteobacteria bacterium]|nr:TIGR03619 family F420-dependent LLM class oxidoreductase [Gammaproteobacteria bacterium]
MKFWQAITWTEPEQLLEVVRHAEEVGFDGVMLSDHGVFPRDVRSPYPYSADGRPPMAPDGFLPDCWATIGALASVTKRIRFAVGIYVLPLRNVFEVARATATLAILSNGRFLLGAGLGWMKEEFDIYGVDFATRGARCDEMIAVLHKLWKGGMVEHHGHHIDFPPLEVSPAPPAPVPIYIGGNSPAALRRAARLADGWIGAGHSPENVPTLLAELARLRHEAGRADLPFEAVVAVAAPPDVDTFRYLGESGMQTAISYPFRLVLGERSTLAEKKRHMDQFAETIIRHCQ